nr:hypothetical protein [Tanacetum cinerariifolium]
MAGIWDGIRDLGSQSDDSFQYERQCIEPIYDSFICPLSKQVMKNGSMNAKKTRESWYAKKTEDDTIR